MAQALAYDAQNPTTFHTSGKNGLGLLLGVLSGRNSWAHFEAVTATAASGMRWNKQFVQLAHAVLLGRDGQYDAADAKVTEALETSSLYPMARYLGLRMVAEPAHADGWGEPVAWLRQAEDYFHNAEIPAVASACRSLLRQLGATVSQRRSGTDQVPAHLRQLGITTPRVRGLPVAGGPDREQVDRLPAAHLAPDGGEACGQPDDQDTATGSGGTEQFRPDGAAGLTAEGSLALVRVLEPRAAGG